MTVSSKVKQTTVSLKGAEATLKIYAEQVQNEELKEIYEKNAIKIKGIVEKLEHRIKTLEFEEPQYKGY